MRRTERLDREKEVALPFIGKDVFATMGDFVNTAEENEQLSQNLKDHKHEQAVVKATEDVLHAVQVFTAQTFVNLAPVRVVEAYTKGGMDAPEVVAWVTENDFHTVQDGLKSVARYRGKVLVDCTHNVPLELKAEVRRRVMERIYA